MEATDGGSQAEQPKEKTEEEKQVEEKEARTSV